MRENEFGSFGEMLVDILETISQRREESIEFKIGDKVLQKDRASVTYLVPFGSKDTIGKDYKLHNKGLDKYFRQTEGIVTHINHDFKFNCGHCSREHSHDLIVYYKEINQSFHSSSHAIVLATEEVVEEKK